MVIFAAALLAAPPGAYPDPQTLHIATLEYPPFIYTRDGRVAGPTADTVRRAFAELGVAIDIQAYPIARGLAMVKTGEADAYFTLKATPERQRDLLFTKVALIRQPFVLFARKGLRVAWTGSVAELRAYRIGVVAKTSYGPIFDAWVKTKALVDIEVSQSFEVNVKKLMAGRVDLIVSSQDVGRYLLRKLGAEGDVAALSPPVEVVDSYLAFTKARDYAALAGAFDGYLAGRER